MATYREILDAPAWDEVVNELGGHPMQAWGWGELKEKTGKNIQVVEYSEDPEQFVKNVFHIYNPQKVVIEQRGNITHATVTVDPKLKGRAIGKAGKNLRIARDIVNRHHEIQSISVD